MTNGEKLVKVFPDIELYKKMHSGIQIDFDSTWWNAEYKEPTTKNDLPHCQHTDEEIAKSFIEDVEAVKDQLPTTKNDLGVERQIKEICISYPKSDLKEHDGQPYYSVKYIEDGDEYEGYGTYKIEVFMEYLKNYFMSSVTPQEPFINKPCVSSGVCEHDKNEILNKIYADIQKLRGCSCSCSDGIIDDIEEIIDKYKGESEG